MPFGLGTFMSSTPWPPHWRITRSICSVTGPKGPSVPLITSCKCTFPSLTAFKLKVSSPPLPAVRPFNIVRSPSTSNPNFISPASTPPPSPARCISACTASKSTRHASSRDWSSCRYTVWPVIWLTSSAHTGAIFSVATRPAAMEEAAS